MMYSGVFVADFKVFGDVKHCLECLIDLLNQS